MIDLKTNNKLFQSAFNISLWKNDDKINFLLENINSIERSIEKHLDNIKNDFPNLTDHSLVHSRMLWNYANIIIGDSSVFLNPLEAFVLHITFLIHDSGMCYSALNNIQEIQQDPLYLDYIKSVGDKNNIEDALFYVVRFRHGDYALRIAIEKLSDDNYLISNISLREELGLIIGKIAKSHTCNINYIDREFGSRYCNPNFPTEWSIDCQKLCYILRTADAAHIDNLRTPKSNKLIQEINGLSKDHWTFQKKLGFPVISDDNLLVYTTNTPFYEKEQKAWWYCYDALKVLDKELKSANEFFEIKKQSCFQAKGVKSINDTLDLGKKYIRTEGWTSIDTNIKVTNPVHIATELGGIKLYGNINAAVRELIQNSIDAINLYRIHTGQDNTEVGELKIAIELEDNKYFLIVTDNGIGMSQNLLTNELLDFGGSYWRNNKFSIEYEGLKAKGFESIGKFGIGFFSIFMLGKRISVTSWKFGESIDNMRTLDFYDGINSNPLLRTPTISEKNRVVDRGTSIKIELDTDPYDKNGFIGNSNFSDNKLYNLIKFFVPSCNVKIIVKEIDGTTNTISPHHLLKLSFKELVDYIHIPREKQDYSSYIDIFKQIKIELIEIKEGETIHGKLALLPEINNQTVPLGVIMSNGIRVSDIGGFAGYIKTDDVVSIKRDSFSKIVPYESMLEWAKKQKEIITSLNLVHLYSIKFIGLLMTFKLHDDSLPILLKKDNSSYSFVSIANFKDDLKKNSEFKIHVEGLISYSSSPSCDGYIDLQHHFNVDQLIKDSDINKLVRQKDLLREIITQIWGEFELIQDNLIEKTGTVETPYVFIETYKKPSPISD